MAKTKLENVTPTPKVVSRGDVEWTDYIMAQAVDGEFTVDKKTGKKCPNVNFLRRITRQEWGDVIFSQPLDVQSRELPDYEEWPLVFTVTFGLKIKDRASGEIYEFADVADVHEKNCDFPFHKFVASASTRAESRAYRKALCLNIVGAEELSEVAFQKNDRPPTPPPAKSQTLTPDSPGSIEANQISGIYKTCRDLKIDADLLIKKKSTTGCESVDQLSYDSGRVVLKLLDGWLKNQALIPEDLRNTFKPA